MEPCAPCLERAVDTSRVSACVKPYSFSPQIDVVGRRRIEAASSGPPSTGPHRRAPGSAQPRRRDRHRRRLERRLVSLRACRHAPRGSLDERSSSPPGPRSGHSSSRKKDSLRPARPCAGRESESRRGPARRASRGSSGDSASSQTTRCSRPPPHDRGGRATRDARPITAGGPRNLRQNARAGRAASPRPVQVLESRTVGVRREFTEELDPRLLEASRTQGVRAAGVEPESEPRISRSPTAGRSSAIVLKDSTGDLAEFTDSAQYVRGRSQTAPRVRTGGCRSRATPRAPHQRRLPTPA